MTVIAQRGNDTFMLLVSGRRDRIHRASVRVFDRAHGVVGDELNGLSVLSRGYWDEVDAGVDKAAVVREAEAILAAASTSSPAGTAA